MTRRGLPRPVSDQAVEQCLRYILAEIEAVSSDDPQDPVLVYPGLVPVRVTPVVNGPEWLFHAPLLVRAVTSISVTVYVEWTDGELYPSGPILEAGSATWTYALGFADDDVHTLQDDLGEDFKAHALHTLVRATITPTGPAGDGGAQIQECETFPGTAALGMHTEGWSRAGTAHQGAALRFRNFDVDDGADGNTVVVPVAAHPAGDVVGPFAPDAENGPLQTFNLTGPATLLTPTSARNGDPFLFIITTNGFELALSGYKLPGGSFGTPDGEVWVTVQRAGAAYGAVIANDMQEVL